MDSSKREEHDFVAGSYVERGTRRKRDSNLFALSQTFVLDWERACTSRTLRESLA